MEKLIKYAMREIKLRNSALWRTFISPKLPPSEHRWIHIGCGEINDRRFINVDARPLKHIHFVTKTPSLIEFNDSFTDLIYACHVLEHFSHKIVLEVLENWYRVLKPGGILRLSVPDFDKLVDTYLATGRDVSSVLWILMGGQEYDYNYHYCAFTENSLSDLLKAVGFSEVRSWSPNDLDDWVEDWSQREHVSLNLEAIK